MVKITSSSGLKSLQMTFLTA